MKKFVLLTNDDGVESQGLAALADELCPDFDVAVAAPDRERSGVSHGLSLRRRIRPELISGPVTRYSIDGTPVDCVKIAVKHLLKRRPDFVVSGINRGANVGVDVLYSGTVGGAIEGAVQGLPSIAVSVESLSAPRFAPAAAFVRRLLHLLDGVRFTPGVALNLNFPDLPETMFRGAIWARQQGMLFRDRFKVREGPDGSPDFELVGEMNDSRDLPLGSDTWALRAGFVTLTPVSAWITSEKGLREFQASMSPLCGLCSTGQNGSGPAGS